MTPLSKQSLQTGNDAQSMDQVAAGSTEVTTEQDHYSVLARMVAEVSQDKAQLRKFVYEFARVKLRKDLYPLFVEGAWSEIVKHVRGLEAAIDRIETDFLRNAPSLQFNSQLAAPDTTQEQSTHGSVILRSGLQQTTRFDPDDISVQSLLLRLSQDSTSSLPAMSDDNDPLANAFLGKHLRSTFWRNTQLIAAAAIGIAIYATNDPKSVLSWFGSHWLDTSTQINSTNNVEKQQNVAVDGKGSTRRPNKGSAPRSNEPGRARAAEIPIPTEYGAYVVTNGQLIELEQLPIRVPDPRVAISAEISMPSRTHLSTGRFQFVVFRRDLMNNAPDRVSVRIVARVKRALTFDSRGNAKTANIEQSWVIRGNAYEMREAPLADNPEMIVIRADPTDFIFPAGRYTLVLKGVGYDFTVDGPQTDTAHCLERTDALNAPIYSECRKL
ncbi:MAG: hypothetical protein ACLPKT_10400 [Methylocella sp.]